MPHLKLEHSKEINTKDLLKSLHAILSDFDSIDPSTIKSRAIPIDSYIVGNKEDRLFISLSLELMEGREEGSLIDILTKLDDGLKEFSRVQDKPIAYSTRLIEIDKKLYMTKNI